MLTPHHGGTSAGDLAGSRSSFETFRLLLYGKISNMRITTNRQAVLEKAKNYNAKGIATSISFLPVRAYRKEQVGNDINEYLSLFDDIPAHGLNSDVTIKFMQFGALTNTSLIRESLHHLLKKGRETKTRVWFDQELNWIVDDVIDIATEQDAGDVGICFQAYRSRTLKDLERIDGYPVRLVKGFYNDYDIRPWSKVTKNYEMLMDEVAKRSSYPCFATHDLALIEKAKKILKDRDGEIQFFAGVRDKLAEELVREGYKVRIYLPYGQVYQFLWYGFHIFDLPRALQRVLKFKTIR